MHAPSTLNWIRAGLLTLPVDGVLTIWATLDPQPNFSEHPEAELVRHSSDGDVLWSEWRWRATGLNMAGVTLLGAYSAGHNYWPGRDMGG